jgi:hypothetical protein
LIFAESFRVTLKEYQRQIACLPFGKKLPGAIYVLWNQGKDFPPELNQLVRNVIAEYEISEDFDLIKFHLAEFKISFLWYPTFFDSAHPELKRAAVIDLTRNSRRDIDYSANPNPPILHRKETFLPETHLRRAEFAALSAAEEQAGLFEDPTRIGFKLNWEKFLAKKGLGLQGHRLIQSDTASSEIADMQRPVVLRHKTALARYDLSKPVKGLLEHGLLTRGTTVLDYGCGQGADVAGLNALGFQTIGWDPVHRPDGPKKPADVVNLGFVLNVIEDPVERVEALIDAYGLAKRLLIVSASDQEALILDCTSHRSRIVVVLDENEAGRTGRTDIATRLSHHRYVRVHQLADEDQQPTDLSPEQIGNLLRDERVV